MSAARETEFSKSYEEIKESGSSSSISRRSQSMEFRNAVERNQRLLEDVRKTEELLSQSQILDPDVRSLEAQYWVSVEAQIPAWKTLLLGKAPDQVDVCLGCPRGKAQQRAVGAKDSSRPPLPRPRMHSVAQGTGCRINENTYCDARLT